MTNIFILYKKEDLNKVKDLSECITVNKSLKVTFRPVTIGKYYHNLMSSIFWSNILVYFVTSNSLKSKWFKLIANNVYYTDLKQYAFYSDSQQDELTHEANLFYKMGRFELKKYSKIFNNSINVRSSFYNIKLVKPSFHFFRKEDIVNFSVFSKAEVKTGQNFIIDIWAYLEKDYNNILNKTKNLKRNEMIASKDGVPIFRKCYINVKLTIDTLLVENNYSQILWIGRPTNASFRIFVPDNAPRGVHDGNIEVIFKGMVIAELFFSIEILEKASSSTYNNITSSIKKIKTAFASYSNIDNKEVYARVQMLNKIAPDLDVYLSRKSIKSGEQWEKEIYKHAPNKDVFYLFWSRNAKKSKWVEKEWRLALDKRNISYIDPVPIESPKIAIPPEELSALHFDDIWVAFKHEKDFINNLDKNEYYRIESLQKK